MKMLLLLLLTVMSVFSFPRNVQPRRPVSARVTTLVNRRVSLRDLKRHQLDVRSAVMIMLGIRDVTLAESKISMSVETVNTP